MKWLWQSLWCPIHLLRKFLENLLFCGVLFQLAREREERNYYQLERDRVQTFWEVASKQVWLHDSARLVVKYFIFTSRVWLTARRMSRRSPSQGPRAGRVGGKAPDWSEGLQAESQASALRTGKSSGRLEGWKHGECYYVKKRRIDIPPWCHLSKDRMMDETDWSTGFLLHKFADGKIPNWK